MTVLNNHPLSLSNLRNNTARDLSDALQTAKRLISSRTGIISSVEYDHMASDEPSVYFARSTPANSLAFNGMETMNYGDATSTDPRRAIMKAVGESIERYCPAHFNYEDFTLAAYNDLAGEAVHPGDFALFSEKQYAEPDFPFVPLTANTPLRWASAFSISHDREVLIPASFIYIPYYFKSANEPPSHNPISTGLACGPHLAPAICKGILEVVERDAFMIMWKNQLPCPRLNLSDVSDPFVQSLLNEIQALPVACQAFLLPSDMDIPVILVLLKNLSGRPPHTVLGMSADLNPYKALTLALEEVCLSWVGMGRYSQSKKDFRPSKDYTDISNLDLHGLVHAVDPDLAKSWEFLNTSGKQVSIDDIKNEYDENSVTNIRTLVDKLKDKNLNVIAKDLTTVDVDEAGFKVVRVVVPGMQPLDINHARRYLGGTRLYDVPCKMGLRTEPLAEEHLNPYPHMFP
ncbi:MAG: YcaO-like family protein [Nitrospinota bacterium]|nr:YcaO-like family protein [Nitrospinota bacterium]